jgi:hypothetical protein
MARAAPYGRKLVVTQSSNRDLRINVNDQLVNTLRNMRVLGASRVIIISYYIAK